MSGSHKRHAPVRKAGDRVRVLFPFVGDSIGGAQISGTTLIENLDREFFEPIVVVHEEGPLTAFLDGKNVKFQLLPLRAYLGQKSGMLNHLIALLVTAPKLVRYLKSNEIEVVHAQDGRMNLTWMLPARLAVVPLIWHQRSKFAKSRLLALGAVFATHIIAISAYTFSTLPGKLKAKTSTIVNPVELGDVVPDRARSRTDLVTALKISPDHPIVGFFGNLTQQKRPDIFIKAAVEYLGYGEEGPTFILFGADRDNMQSELTAQIRELGQEGRILFGGFVMEPERWMAGCDAIVAPGVEDAFGRTLVEAMLVGTPVVAANSGGHIQIIQDGGTGTLVPPDDVSAFAVAIGDILRNDVISASMVRFAAGEVASRFSIKEHVADVSKIYFMVLGLDPA